MPLYCPHCDYDLTGLAERRCPECGTLFDPDELARAAEGRRRIGRVWWVLLLSWPAVVFAIASVAIDVFRWKRTTEIYGAAFIAMIINTGLVSEWILPRKRRANRILYAVRRNALQVLIFALLFLVQLAIAVAVTFGVEMALRLVAR